MQKVDQLKICIKRLKKLNLQLKAIYENDSNKKKDYDFEKLSNKIDRIMHAFQEITNKKKQNKTIIKDQSILIKKVIKRNKKLQSHILSLQNTVLKPSSLV